MGEDRPQRVVPLHQALQFPDLHCLCRRHATVQAALRPRAPAAALHAAAAPPPAGAAARLPHCAYEEAVQRAVDSSDRPQLSRGQLLFIAAAVRTQTRLAGAPANFLVRRDGLVFKTVDFACPASRRPTRAAHRIETQYLTLRQFYNQSETVLQVFGLGHDSTTWQEANCGGRTVFLEENRSWLDKIKGGAPGLEAYLVTYRGRVDQADAFFEAPWLMEMPQAVSSTCFDAILVDGPTGYDAASPGRMEAAHFAVEHAIKCMKAGNTVRSCWGGERRRPLDFGRGFAPPRHQAL